MESRQNGLLYVDLQTALGNDRFVHYSADIKFLH